MSFNTVVHHPLIKSEDNYVLSRRLVSIHSVDRDISQWPYSNTFAVELPEDMLNVQTMRLSMVNFPATFYNFSNEYQNTKLTFDLSGVTGPPPTPFTITIPDGFYKPECLANMLQFLMNEAISGAGASGMFVVGYNSPSQQFDFIYTGSEVFSIYAGKQETYTPKQCSRGTYYYQYANWGAGFNLGFDKLMVDGSQNEGVNSPSVATTPSVVTADGSGAVYYGWKSPPYQLLGVGQHIRAPNVAKLFGDQVIYMEVEKYNSLDEIYPYTDTGISAPPLTTPNAPRPISGHVKSAFAKIPVIMTPPAEVYVTPNDFAARTYFSPPAERIRRLKFKFRTHDGRLIDFQDSPFNFSLEFYGLHPEQLRRMNITVPEVYRI